MLDGRPPELHGPLKASIRKSPTSRSRASSSTTSPRCSPICRAFATPSTRSPRRTRAGHRTGRRHREPRVHPRRGGGRPPGRRVRAGAQAREAAGDDAPGGLRARVRDRRARDCIEDAVQPGQRVLLVDDVLATGGTARAAPPARSASWRRPGGACVPDRAELPERPGEARRRTGVFRLQYSAPTAPVAQGIEHPPPKRGAGSSNLPGRANILRKTAGLRAGGFLVRRIVQPTSKVEPPRPMRLSGRSGVFQRP